MKAASGMRGGVLGLAAICGLVLAAPAWAQAEGSSPIFSASTSSASLLGLSSPGSYLGATETGENRFTNIRFEVHLDFNWYGAFGIGARVEFPLARNGIIDGVDDEIALSLGAEFFFYYNRFYATDPRGQFGVIPIVAVQWNFFLNRNISIFPELGVAFLLGQNYYWGTFIAPYIGFGFRYHFTDRNALLLRVSWPAGFQVGITF